MSNSMSNEKDRDRIRRVFASALEIQEHMLSLFEDFEDLDITSDLSSVDMLLPKKDDYILDYLINDASRLIYHIKRYRQK